MDKKLKESLLKEKIQTLVQIGDARYLQYVLKKNSLGRREAIQKMIEEPDTPVDAAFNPV